jgi:3-methyladenine DNA glycosylase Mpg
MTGMDLLDPRSPLRLESAPAGEPTPQIATTPRLGIDFAGSPWTEVPWRFVIAGNPSVSGTRSGRAR